MQNTTSTLAPTVATTVAPIADHWQSFEHGGAILRAQPGSWGARIAPVEVRRAARMLNDLRALLPAESNAAKVNVALRDAPFKPNGAADVWVVGPDYPGESLAEPLTRALLAARYGARAARTDWLWRGLSMLTQAQSDAAVGRALNRLRSESADTMPGAGGPPGTGGPPPGAGGPPPGAGGPPPGSGGPPLGSGGPPPGAGGPPNSNQNNAGEDALFVEFLARDGGQWQVFLEALREHEAPVAAQRAWGKSLAALRSNWNRELARGRSFLRLLFNFGRELWPLLKPFRWQFLLMLCCNLSAGGLALAFPTALGLISANPRFTGLILTALALAFVVSAALMRLGATLSANLNARLLRGLQEQLIGHLYQLSHNFYNRRDIQTGDVTARLLRDLPTVQQALSQLGTAAPQIFMLLGGGGFLMVLNPLLGTIILVFVLPAFFVMNRRMSKRMEQSSRRLSEAAASVSAHVSESLGAQSFMKAYGLETNRMDEMMTRLAEQEDATRKLGAVMAAFQSGSVLVISFSQVLALALLSTRGDNLTQAVSLLGMVVGPVMGLSGLAQGLQNAPGALRRVRELLDEPIAVTDAADATALPELKGEIRFEDVWFSYEPGRPVLKGLNLTIRAGESVAIVGPSGSGKSTIANLLLRFWDADEGQILWDGADVRAYTLASLRAHIGLVQQETTVFKASLGENIVMGRSGLQSASSIGAADIAQAASRARLDEFVASQPAGLNTQLGERGAQMSGGQRQRLSIARALLRRPSLLVLDEATSALDAVTEREIQATLEEIAAGATTISITHRLSLAARADRIVVLQDGQLVEDGTHAELLEKRGAYWQLHQAQQQGDAPDSTAALSEGGAHILSNVPLLSSLDDAALTRLEAAMTRQMVATGAPIVRQGEPGDRLYFVTQGSAEAVVSDGEAESERRVNVLRGGDYFGEMALLDDAPRNATVRALEPSTLYSLQRAAFMELLETDAALQTAVAQTVEARRAAMG